MSMESPARVILFLAYAGTAGSFISTVQHHPAARHRSSHAVLCTQPDDDGTGTTRGHVRSM